MRRSVGLSSSAWSPAKTPTTRSARYDPVTWQATLCDRIPWVEPEEIVYCDSPEDYRSVDHVMRGARLPGHAEVAGWYQAARVALAKMHEVLPGDDAPRIHGRITEHNLLVSQSTPYRVAIANFGDDPALDPEKLDAVSGSVVHVGPEQLRLGAAAGVRADEFAVASVMYLACTRALLYPETRAVERVRRFASGASSLSVPDFLAWVLARGGAGH